MVPRRVGQQILHLALYCSGKAISTSSRDGDAAALALRVRCLARLAVLVVEADRVRTAHGDSLASARPFVRRFVEPRAWASRVRTLARHTRARDAVYS